MKLFNIILIIFITLTNGIKADSENQILENLKTGGKLIFIRHAYAPGNGDPDNFNITDCNTQRNLNYKGKEQAKKIGKFFKENEIIIDKILTSEWCRCKETAKLAFGEFSIKSFLNSFYSFKFAKNKTKQMKDLKRYVKISKSKNNLIFVTHYVVISEILDYAPSSGEIVISDQNLKKIGSIKINY